jgi:hypothetical protein
LASILLVERFVGLGEADTAFVAPAVASVV